MKTLIDKFRLTLTICAVVCAGGRFAKATIYNDGGSHTISGADSNVAINNGTTVNVVSGATITGTSVDPFGVSAVTVGDAASTLNVTGGSMTGGDGSHGGGSGLNAANGHFNISGGSFSGGSSSGTTPNELGGSGAAFNNFQSLSISGGSFIGGTSGNPGNGVQINGGSATALISGGTFYGAINSPANTMISYGMEIHGTSVPLTAVISGGTFAAGGFGVHLIGGASVNVTGGQFSSDLILNDSSVANVSGGHFSTGADINLHDNALANVSNGQIYQINLQNFSIANVSGGQLTGEFSLFDNSVMNLTGGSISALTPPPTFYLAGLSVLNVYGTGLSLDSLGGVSWELHGTLQDGTPIPSNTDVYLFDSSKVNLFQTPEPSAILLAASGLAGLVAWGWTNSSRRFDCR